MKILLVADQESKLYWDYFKKEYFEGIDLIISCGDLKAEYLSFLATMVPVPVLYVHGNHDYKYERKPPEGCICIDDTIFEYEGIGFLPDKPIVTEVACYFQKSKIRMTRTIAK